jgi:hypothetical protein
MVVQFINENRGLEFGLHVQTEDLYIFFVCKYVEGYSGVLESHLLIGRYNTKMDQLCKLSVESFPLCYLTLKVYCHIKVNRSFQA